MANRFDKMLVPRSKCQNNNQFEPLKHAVFYLRTSLLLYESRQQCQLFTTISVLSTFSFLDFPLLLISISFFFLEGETISFQNNLFHHLTMKSKIDYRSLIMMIIPILIFSKKELLIKRKKKKHKSNFKKFDYWKIEIIRNYNYNYINIITDGKVYLFTYCK